MLKLGDEFKNVIKTEVLKETNLKISYTTATIVNCNEKNTRTETIAVYGSSNAPTAGIGILEILYYSKDWILQRFTSIEVTPRFWVRTFHSGTTWGSWEQKW